MEPVICNKNDVILVVDDEEAIEEAIEMFVERHRCKHLSFNDPVEALEYCEKHSKQVTLMISDLPCRT
jgi:CheY-like chemotaxis protein